MFWQKNEEWLPVCGDTLKHNFYPYIFEKVGAMVYKELKKVEILERTLVKYQTISHILEFCNDKNKGH